MMAVSGESLGLAKEVNFSDVTMPIRLLLSSKQIKDVVEVLHPSSLLFIVNYFRPP